MSDASNTPSNSNPSDIQKAGANASRVDAAHAVGPAHDLSSKKSDAHVQRVLSIAQQAAATANGPTDDHTATVAGSEQVERQARELAEQLQRRQNDIDRRAAMLATQEAEIENKVRSARLWFEEQQQELEARQEQLERLSQSPRNHDEDSTNTQTQQPPIGANAKQTVELEARQRELDARQAAIYQQIEEATNARAEVDQKAERVSAREAKLRGREEAVERRLQSLAEEREAFGVKCRDFDERQSRLDRRGEELESRDAELRSREGQLAFRRQEIETALARFEKLGVTHDRMQALDAQANDFAIRSRYLDQAEEQLKEEHCVLAERRQQVEDEQRAAQEQLREDRNALLGEQVAFRDKSAQRTKELDLREGELDSREASLTSLRVELEASQREVLEMRLATEETWAQLTGALSPASLTRSIAQTRSRLADHYEQQLQELCNRREEMERFREELSDQHTQLEHRRSQLNDWLRRREEEVEQQAGRLISREQELDRQQMHYESLESKWRLERDDYRAEIRQLLTQLRKGILEAAAA